MPITDMGMPTHGHRQRAAYGLDILSEPAAGAELLHILKIRFSTAL
jgi:hypothetical protein